MKKIETPYYDLLRRENIKKHDAITWEESLVSEGQNPLRYIDKPVRVIIELTISEEELSKLKTCAAQKKKSIIDLIHTWIKSTTSRVKTEEKESGTNSQPSRS